MGAPYPEPSSSQAEVFAGRSRINIEPEDFFILDPSDLEKTEWIKEARKRIESQQKITLLAHIPDGEYVVYRLPDDGTFQPPPSRGAAPNLRIKRSEGNTPIAFRLILSPSGSSVNVIPIRPEFDFWAKFAQPDFKILRTGVAFNSESGFEGEAEVRAFHRFSKNFAFQTQFEAAFRRHHDTLDLEDLLPTVIDRPDRLTDPTACQGFTQDGSCFDEFNSREFQLDFGPVIRFRNVQVAAMQSIRWINRSGWDETGTIGQYFFNFGYVFSRGQIGGFFTRSNLDESVVRRVPFDEVFLEETFLKVADQVGVNFNVHLFDDVSMEGAFGRVDSALRDSVPGGTLRVHLPRFWKLIPSAEFGINESFIAAEDSYRFGFSVRFGEWGTGNDPRTFARERNLGPAPVFVPRVRYETLTRLVRGGNRAPIADAGPDMLNLEPFSRVVLDGTNSSDPDGDPIESFQWTLLDDCPATIEIQDPQSPVASLVIGNGETCSVQLVVTDVLGAVSEPDVKAISSQRVGLPTVVSFTADPSELRAGEPVLLAWEVSPAFPPCPPPPAEAVNCFSLELTNVPAEAISNPSLPSGQATVRPTDTITYGLTVCNVVNECATAETTVLVRPDLPIIRLFQAEPAEVRIEDPPAAGCQTGEAATFLQWETENAAIVALTNSGGEPDTVPPISPEGGLQVCVSANTTFTLTATNDRGEIVSAEASVVVRPLLPVISRFTATPPELRIEDPPAEGCAPEQGRTVLEWSTENATVVTLTNSLSGDSNPVSANSPPGGLPMCLSQSTTFTLTAANDSGEIVEAQSAVVVRPILPFISRFTATPPQLRIGDEPAPGCEPGEGRTVLEWSTNNASVVNLTNSSSGDSESVGAQSPPGGLEVCLSESVTFTLTAANDSGEIVSAEAAVVVRPPLPLISSFSATPPDVRIEDPPEAGCDMEEARSVLEWATQNASVVTLTNSTSGVEDRVSPNSPPGGFAVCLSDTTTFTLTAANDLGEIVSAAVTVVVRPTFPEIVLFAASDPEIRIGEKSKLSWRVLGVSNVAITNVPGNPTLDSEGMVEVEPQVTTTYVLTATNNRGEFVSAEVTIVVLPPLPRVISLIADPSEIPPNGETTVSWMTEGADDVVLTNGMEPPNVVEPNGMRTFTLDQTTTFTLTATNPAGESASASVTVRIVLPPPIIDFFEGPFSVLNGSRATLRWQTTNAVAVTLTSGLDEDLPPGPLPLSGSIEVLVDVSGNQESATFTLTAIGADGQTVSRTITIDTF